MSPGQRARRTGALPRHGHKRSDAVRRLFLDRFVFSLRGPRERGHGAAVARHGLGVDARQGHVFGERSGTAVPGQQQTQPRVQRVRVATPFVQRASRSRGSAFVICG